MRPSCSSPRRVLARLAVPAVLTLGAVAGCGGSSPAPAAPPSAAPSPAGSSPAASPPAGSSPAAAPATTAGPGSAPGAAAGPRAGRACTAGQVSLTVIGTNGAAGTLVDAVRLTNRGTAACTVTGYVDLAV